MHTGRLLTVSRRGGVSASGPRGVSASGQGGPTSGLWGVCLWWSGSCLWSLGVSASGLEVVSLWSWEMSASSLHQADTPPRKTPPAKCMLGYTPPPSSCGIHTYPVDRQTPVKTLPSQTLFVSGDNLFTFTSPVYYLVFDDTYSQLEFLNNNGCGNRDGVAPGVIPAGSRCEILSWILLRRRYGGYHHFHLIGICRPFVRVRLKESGRGGSKIFWDRGGANMLLGHSFSGNGIKIREIERGAGVDGAPHSPESTTQWARPSLVVYFNISVRCIFSEWR